MGQMKKFYMEQQEQGWDFSEMWVCTRCVDDDALEKIIAESAQEGQECNFCENRPAAPLDVLLEAFMNGISHEYGDVDNEGVPYETAEGGYHTANITDTWDIVDEFGYVLVGDGLIDAVQRHLHHRLWTERNWAHRRRDEVLTDSWEQFSYAVKYETRYVFWLRKSPDDEDAEFYGEIPAGRILDHVGRLIEMAELVRRIPAGTRFWRARTHDGSTEWKSADVGTVPKLQAVRGNRMSPAGIPLFYGAADKDTAIAEVSQLQSAHENVTVCQFEIMSDCDVIDFTNIRPVPSLFDAEWGPVWRQFRFLHHFIERISSPVSRELEQIEYVPTQIVTEYFLKIFGEASIDGIAFNSAVNGGIDVVLDVPNERCFDATPVEPVEKLSLRLIEDSMQTRKILMPERAE